MILKPNTIVSDLSYWLPLIHTMATSKGVNQPQICIIANKYDLVGDQIELICRTIRSIALRHDCSVITHAIDNRNLHQQFRSTVSRFFTDKTPPKLAIQTDHLKPLLIPARTDSFENIGLPARSDSNPDPCVAWCKAFRAIYPDEVIESRLIKDLKLEPEPSIDMICLQKQEELQRETSKIKHG